QIQQLSLQVLYCALHLAIFTVELRRYHLALDSTASFILSYTALLSVMCHTLAHLYTFHLDNPYLMHRLMTVDGGGGLARTNNGSDDHRCYANRYLKPI